MKAITYQRYGGPEVLKLTETLIPEPKPGEVLVKIRASSVNSWDWDMLTGKPRLYRLLFGLFKPKFQILGLDIAGIVEKTAADVSRFKTGDAVFGDISEVWGGFAEYCCVPEERLLHKPSGMSFIQAASMPHTGLLAWQALYNAGPIKPGARVLINGAGGGAGTFAIQLAKNDGAVVTAVDSGEKEGFLRDLGADHFMDYRKTDYTRTGDQYDLIVDTVAQLPPWRYAAILSPQGRFVMIGGRVKSILQLALLGRFFSRTGGKNLGLLVHKPNKNLHLLIKSFEAGKLTPVIDRVYPLEEVPLAMERMGAGMVRGKIIISISGDAGR